MSKKSQNTFEIRFDKHGHILIDDPELKRRLLYVLEHDQRLVMNFLTPDPEGDEPERLPLYRCPAPEPIPLPVPNMMCGPCDLIVRDQIIYTTQLEGNGNLEPDLSQRRRVDR